MQTTKRNVQRKLLWLLPLMAVPFITMLFWSMGGGSPAINPREAEKGINLELPQNTLPEESYSKLNYYDRAELDSAKRLELMKKDPYYEMQEAAPDAPDSAGKLSTSLGGHLPRSSNEQKVLERLKTLQSAIATPPEPLHYSPRVSSSAEMQNQMEIRKLESTMAAMQSSSAEDPEMQQINGVLQSILDIQHPQRVEERRKATRRLEQGAAYTITKPREAEMIGMLQPPGNALSGKAQSNDFYAFAENHEPSDVENSINATVAETQTCINGTTVKLRLSQDIALAGIEIPKNTFVYGIASLKGERLTLDITSVRYRNAVLPVEFVLYDMDGLEGIFIPGAISRDVAKASADRSVQSLGLTTLDDSWGSQAAGAGIEAAKSLLSKKVKQVKVIVKAGYRVLLKEKKNTNP